MAIKKFRITVNGKAYDVAAEILSDTTAPVVSSAPAQSSSVGASVDLPTSAPKKAAVVATAGSGEIPSPLAGKVVSIDAKVGAVLKEGEKILTLEAMKMNTFVLAPRAGTLKEVLVNAGQAVAEGAPLARLE